MSLHSAAAGTQENEKPERHKVELELADKKRLVLSALAIMRSCDPLQHS